MPRSRTFCLAPASFLALTPALALSLGCGSSGVGDETVGSTSAAVTVCAAGTTLSGVDVSSYQGTINWAEAKASGLSFAIARVSDGTDKDGDFATNWSGMKSAGLVRGVYQYFEAADDPTTQANLLLDAIGTLGPGDLPPVADVEVLGGASGATLVANLATWVSVVKTATGRTPIIYTAEGFWDSLPDTNPFSDVTLWVANWGVSCPDTPTPWTAWSLWQYNDNGSVSGISGDVDVDTFNGTLAELQALAGGGDAGAVTTPGLDAGTGSPAGTWGAAYVAQSFPLATTTLTMTAGETLPSYIELKNIGTHAWDDQTRIGTTEPEDRVSVFADATWLASDRPAGVTGSVAVGASHKFTFNLHAPATPGTYTEHFGVLEEGVSWFSAAGQDGPADDDLEVKIEVVAGEGGTVGVADGSTPTADAGASLGGDASTSTPFDAGTVVAPNGAGDSGSASGAGAHQEGGAGASPPTTGPGGGSGGCAVSQEPRGAFGTGAWVAFGALFLASRRRRRPDARRSRIDAALRPPYMPRPMRTLLPYASIALLVAVTVAACDHDATPAPVGPTTTVSSAAAPMGGAAAPAAPALPTSAGDLAVASTPPDFSATASDGTKIQLSALKGKPVVVYFYPKDETPGCTTEACSFRDAWNSLAAKGVVLIGVSADDDASHRAFAANHKLPFLLVSDSDGSIAKKFGVPMNNGYIARQSIVIGAEGKVKKIYRTVDVSAHAAQIAADVQ